MKFGTCPACHKNFHFFVSEEVLKLWAVNMSDGKPIYRKEMKGKDTDYLEIHYYIVHSKINIMLKEVLLVDGADTIDHHIFFYLDRNLQIRGLGCKKDQDILEMFQGFSKNKITKDHIPRLVGATYWDEFLQTCAL